MLQAQSGANAYPHHQTLLINIQSCHGQTNFDTSELNQSRMRRFLSFVEMKTDIYSYIKLF